MNTKKQQNAPWEYKFTPTPWKIVDYGYGYCIEPNICWIGENSKTTKAQLKANAHLLNAAPKMYLFIELVSKVSHDPELRNHAQFLLREANGEKPKIRKGNQK